jgi:hypothetical protein
VTVEHVHVHSGGQAVVGMVGPPGGGAPPKREEQPHAKQIGYAPQLPMWSADKEREPVPIALNAERPVPTTRRKISGAPKGNKNALCRLSERHPRAVRDETASIVQRLLKALRQKAAEKLTAQEPPCPVLATAPQPEAVDGSGCTRPDPPTAPPFEQPLEVESLIGSGHIGLSAPTAPPG